MNLWRRIALLIALTWLAYASTACTVATTSTPSAQAISAPTTDQGGSAPTAEFRVELPVSATPTPAPSTGGTPLPTNTLGPTNTPRPTKTPWPTRAPTSAPADDPSMVYVPGGPFLLGSDKGHEDESPQQTVEVAAFNIDKNPVTNVEYKKFVDATGHRAPRHWQDGKIPAGKEDHPVVWVSWDDAAAYAAWAGKRLPTEIEWEKAARGTDGRVYPWGNTFDAALCNAQEASRGDTTPVGQYPGGASPSGALDMAGNVWEWTADWYQGYRGSVYQMDLYGTTNRVLRGGSWFDAADLVRTTARNSAKPDFRFSTIGFRCAR